ncbi:pyridoxamine 5'-phosphate oxidase family protein [Streptomyces nanshensis]|uniref:Pyridoxamine 5'-phosphate oxidase n=1 Tax=Streptomyces nanshensis TaxID=518642 RepID=A0A1E7L835_9ACTN|nr:pyridoxamine 5'-phosphate oxidase family protein [Streptomyces nanshensis]OEV12344.1 hypothetical protein AN218_08660 [Streptomyces nanshensis]
MMTERTGRPPQGTGRAEAARYTWPLERGEGLRLLTSVSLGRLFFTRRALPAVCPVHHVLDGDDIVFRLGDGAALAAVAPSSDGTGTVVAYEADAIDPDHHLGWSVVVTGYVHRVEDPAELRRYEPLLRHWAPQPTAGTLRISPELVTGFRFTAGRPAG